MPTHLLLRFGVILELWLIKVLTQKPGSRGWGAQFNISDRCSPTRASDYKPSKETVVR